MKKIIYSIGFIAGSLLSAGMLISCGDQFQEEYPWMIGKQEDMDNSNEAGAGATDITVLEKELRGAIPFMNLMVVGLLISINIIVPIVLTTMPDIGLLRKVLLLLVVRYLLFIHIPMTTLVVLWIIRFLHSLLTLFFMLQNLGNLNGVLSG